MPFICPFQPKGFPMGRQHYNMRRTPACSPTPESVSSVYHEHLHIRALLLPTVSVATCVAAVASCHWLDCRCDVTYSTRVRVCIYVWCSVHETILPFVERWHWHVHVIYKRIPSLRKLPTYSCTYIYTYIHVLRYFIVRNR